MIIHVQILKKFAVLAFEEPDMKTFRNLSLAIIALGKGRKSFHAF